MINYTDLSADVQQGAFGHDMIDALKEPGFYKLPIRTYNDGNGEHHRNIVVEVISIFVRRGTQLIVVPDDADDYYYIFYYNGNERCFKPNFDASDDYDNILEWIDCEAEHEDEPS